MKVYEFTITATVEGKNVKFASDKLKKILKDKKDVHFVEIRGSVRNNQSIEEEEKDDKDKKPKRRTRRKKDF